MLTRPSEWRPFGFSLWPYLSQCEAGVHILPPFLRRTSSLQMIRFYFHLLVLQANLQSHRWLVHASSCSQKTTKNPEMARTCHTAIQVQVLETGRSGAQADPASNLDACANPVTSHVFDFGHPKTCSFAASKEVPRYSKWPYTTNKEKPRGDPWGIRSLINNQQWRHDPWATRCWFGFNALYH